MDCLRRGPRLSIALCLAILYPACMGTTSRFVQSDKSFVRRPGPTSPKIFLDQSPKSPFTSVGIVEVQGPVSSTKEVFLDAALSKGTKLGCDVLVHRAVYENRQGPTLRSRRNGVASWLFTCGVFDAAKHAEESARLSNAVAQQIVRSEYGDLICTREASTGTHLVMDVCRLPGSYRVWGNGTPWLASVR